jgi:hypothetical protein
MAHQKICLIAYAALLLAVFTAAMLWQRRRGPINKIESMSFYPNGVNWMAKRDCWLAYFDLLGFGSKVIEGGFGLIVNDYSQCLDEAARQCSRARGVEYAWFSDTFLFYTDNRTDSSFIELERVSRSYITFLTQKQIAMRGALTCGEFLADKDKQVFVGPALVNAHSCGERYNWIGFVLSNSAVENLTEKGLIRQHYTQWPTEFKIPNTIETNTEPAWALKMIESNGQAPCLASLQAMANRVNKEHRPKYDNAIRFLEAVIKKS